MSEDRVPYKTPKQRESEMSADEYLALIAGNGKAAPPTRGKFGEEVKPDRKPKEDPEHELQVFIVNDFRKAYPHLANLLFAIPNGGKLPYHKDKKTGRFTSPQRIKLVNEGMLSGVPDLCLAVARGRFHGMYMEVKIYPNGLTPEQEHRFRDFTEQGYYCVKVLDRAEAEGVFHSYLTLP